MIRVMMLKNKIHSYHGFTKQERDLLMSFCELYGDGSSWLFQTARIIHDMPDFARRDTIRYLRMMVQTAKDVEAGLINGEQVERAA
jgi:hypothetical protein